MDSNLQIFGQGLDARIRDQGPGQIDVGQTIVGEGLDAIVRDLGPE